MALAVRNNALREMPPFLSSKKSVDILREKLILSGIEEIQLHGVRDFSLRKAATCCELSSPHSFRDKNDFFPTTAQYIYAQWSAIQQRTLESRSRPRGSASWASASPTSNSQ